MKSSRAREAEERRPEKTAPKQGRAIKEADVVVEDSKTESDEEGLGGCKDLLSAAEINFVDTDSFADGFFDAGMLLQALKASQEGERPSERAAGHARKEIGKKLRLSEY